jgi:hypothetical protein
MERKGGGGFMIGRIAVCVTAALFAFTLSGCTNFGLQPQFKAEVMMSGGERVRLFYGGTQEAKNIFCVGETVTVYRATPPDSQHSMEVGHVRILRALDDQYLEGEVVDGRVREGDLARKAIAACMVLPLKPH